MTQSGLATSHADSVAIVDDDPVIADLLGGWLQELGYRVSAYHSGAQALARVGAHTAVVCLDLNLGDMSGLRVLERLKAAQPDVPVVVVTATNDVETAVSAMRAHAYDYLVKPLEKQRFLAAIRRGVERKALVGRVRSLENELARKRGNALPIVGDSPAMREVFHQMSQVRDSDVDVCVLGESGTGKELVARALHNNGRRQGGPFVAINCAAVPESLQESELFGHERGAFTGANTTRKGRFEQADGGTLFLDEIGEMSPATQATLLRTLQERTICRVGGSRDIPVDVRIISATHRDLRSDVQQGTFRQDLYYRLVVYPIRLPALRDRSSDVPLLVRHFLSKLNADSGNEVTRMTADALEAMCSYHWPGNVRELGNIVHRALLACDGPVIELGHLPRECRAAAFSPPVAAGLSVSDATQDQTVVPLKELELRAIRHALGVTAGNVSRAAKLLGVGRTTLYRRMGALGLRHLVS